MLSWLTPTNMVIIHLIQCSHSRGNRKLETQGRHQRHGTPRTLPRIRETERYFCPFFHLPVVHLFIRLSIHIPKCRVWINEQCSPPHLQLKLSDPQPEAVNKPAVKYYSTIGLVPSMGRNIQGWIKANCEKKKKDMSDTLINSVLVELCQVFEQQSQSEGKGTKVKPT